MKLIDLKSKYKNKWVLGRVTKQDKAGNPEEIEPISTSNKKASIDQKLEDCPEKHVTVIYTGEPKARI